MALYHSLLLGICFLISSINALFQVYPDEYCVYACNAVSYKISLDGVEDECSNPLIVNSTYYCAATYCTAHEIEVGLKSSNEYCVSIGEPLPDYQSVVARVDLSRIRRVTGEEASKQVFYRPVIPDKKFFDTGHHTVKAFYDNISLTNDFSWSLYGYWGLVLLVGMVSRAFDVYSHRRTPPILDGHGARNETRPSVFTRTWLWIRRRLILTATFNRCCQEPIGWCTIPPRLESILIALFIALNIVYCFPGYDLFLPNSYYNERKKQLVRYISDRTGILSIANLPMVWVFAARNDPFLWLTGWSFATYNRFHRWVARIATVQAVVHSIGYSVSLYYIGPKVYTAEWSWTYWYTGGIATVVMCLILGFSVYGLRKSHYDLFLTLHIVFAVIFLVCLWRHVYIFGDDFMPFVWPCVAIWSLDRVLRICRIIYCSLLPYFVRQARAVASYDEQADIIRLDVTDFLPTKEIEAGLYYYVYLPTSMPSWESHPLTLCSWRASYTSSPTDSPRRSESENTKEMRTYQTAARDPETQSQTKHSFLIRPYAGMTARMKRQITSTAETSRSPTTLKVLLEGPYGISLILENYTDILIIAGGSGITAAISHSHRLISRGETRIRIIWAVAQKALVDDVCQHELRGVLSKENVQLDVYLTEGAVLEGSKAGDEYTVHLGRPDIDKVMAEAQQVCRRDLAIVSCGTPAMADACRKAVVSILSTAGPHVGYFNETLTW